MAATSSYSLDRPTSLFAGRGSLLDRYFYFAISLLFAAIVIWGFSHSVDHNLFHATPPRPLLLWIHGAAFSLWIVFYILQSALVRTRNVNIHRSLGWFGAGLGALMVGLGLTIAVTMTRFDIRVLHEPGVEHFLSIPIYDMAAFGTLVGLAVYWRRKPELHRRLLFIASCQLLDAAFGRFDPIFNNNLYYYCVDGIILLGVARDLAVDRRVHRVYWYALPSMAAAQAYAIHLYLAVPAWWGTFTRAVAG